MIMAVISRPKGALVVVIQERYRAYRAAGTRWPPWPGTCHRRLGAGHTRSASLSLAVSHGCGAQSTIKPAEIRKWVKYRYMSVHVHISRARRPAHGQRILLIQNPAYVFDLHLYG